MEAKLLSRERVELRDLTCKVCSGLMLSYRVHVTCPLCTFLKKKKKKLQFCQGSIPGLVLVPQPNPAPQLSTPSAYTLWSVFWYWQLKKKKKRCHAKCHAIKKKCWDYTRWHCHIFFWTTSASPEAVCGAGHSSGKAASCLVNLRHRSSQSQYGHKGASTESRKTKQDRATANVSALMLRLLCSRQSKSTVNIV